MFCSIIIPTIGRDTLRRAVSSALAQTAVAADVEVIVVNDSGYPLCGEAWQRSPRVEVIATCRRERSVARNTGAAIAHGRYLLFLDDDDWLLPGAVARLEELSQRSEAAWLYGCSRLVDRSGQPILELEHKIQGNAFLHSLSGEWIPLQASLIRADAFFAAGGFNPLISGPEDVDLLRRITLQGDVASTSALIACISWGDEGSSTDYGNHVSYSRWAREQILDRPQVFQRLSDAATSPRWHGRLIRIYLTSTLWNLRRRRLLTAAERGSLGVRGLIKAGPRHMLTSVFWHSVLNPYKSETFENGLREARTLA